MRNAYFCFLRPPSLASKFHAKNKFFQDAFLGTFLEDFILILWAAGWFRNTCKSEMMPNGRHLADSWYPVCSNWPIVVSLLVSRFLCTVRAHRIEHVFLLNHFGAIFLMSFQACWRLRRQFCMYFRVCWRFRREILIYFRMCWRLRHHIYMYFREC